MLEELNNANESMSAELGPLAQQKGVVLVDQGEQLILQWKGENKEENLINQNICERIAQKVQILKEAVIAVVQLASEKIGASKTQKIVEKLNILDKWLNTVADPFLSESVVLSPVATETTEFIAKHKKVLAEITENENLLKSVQNHQKLLDSNQLELLLNIQRKMISYKSVIEKRINLATKLEQLQKLGRELETSLHFLATLLQGGGYRLETEQHVNNLLQTVKEHCIREKQQTDTFQQMASDLIPNDSNLITIEALHWSHSQGVSHQRQFALLEQQCHQFMNFKEIQQENSFKNQKIQQPSIKTIQENKQKIIEELGEYNREINLEQKMNFENGDSHGPNVPPSIGPPLCSQLVREGQTVVLKTRVRGTPSPKVHWFYNDCPIDFERSDIGLSLHQDGQCILTIPCVLIEHAGQYSIKAENLGGRATSTATLNVLLGIGSPAAPPGQFQFPSSMKNKMEEQKQQQYYIENNYNNFQQTKHQGPVYALIKSEGSESRRASDGDIMDPGYSSLANPPECFRPFRSEVTINEGEKAEVDCMILGNPRPKVQWFFNGRQIKSNAEFVELSNIGDTYSIRFNSARLECAGWYRLIADNIRGRCESLTLIHIRPKSLIPKPIGNNQRARRSIGGVQGLLQWQKQRQQLLQQQQARALSTPPRRDFEGKRHSTSSAHAEMIGIMSTSDYEPDRRESGLEIFVNGYTGNEASEFNNYPEINRTPSSDQEPTLILSPKIIYQNNSDVEPPHFTKTLVSAIVNEGQNVKFEAVVTGIPIPNLVWSKDGNLLKSDGHNSIYLDNYGKTILSINNININDAGKYCCTAENKAGKACSSAQLVLSAKMIAPDFVERLVSQEVEIDSSLIWTVRTSGDPEPLVKWFRDGNIISTDFSIKNSIQTTKDAPFVYSLRIEFLKMEHAGQYTCLLENVAGEARSTADLVVRPTGAPPGKYVHVTKVTQERQESQLAKNEIVILKNKEDNNL
uniref:Ig-like domain-containing protein n=1 Tax=Meloidogyne hapla TaxID=6305 RepID=A0A1I8BJY4_MELHA